MLDLVRPLCHHNSPLLLNIVLIFLLVVSIIIGGILSSTELFDRDIVRLVEVRFSHHQLQYVTLVLVDDLYSDEATSNLSKEIFHKRYSCIKLSSGSTKLNVILEYDITNPIRDADLVKLFLL